MIVVRDIFQLQFGKAREATDLLKQGQAALQRGGYPADRILADVTGDYYTLVMESRFESLSKFEEALDHARDLSEWQEIYRRLVPLVRSGRREVFREVA
jgi:hypothetical protein